MALSGDIRAARERIADHLVRTPCAPSPSLTEVAGARVWFKFENLQRTGSFKERGALNRILAIPEEERARGVIAASAGNHAQAVSFHARRLGVPATIVMPRRTPLVKVANTRGYGARVVLEGAIYDEAMDEALRIRAEEGSTLIHPFDDPMVIAGQGTVGLELLDQLPELDVVVVPVGGGGLIAGIAAAIKEARPSIRLVGVEAEAVAAARAARDAGERVTVPLAETIADGIAVRRMGEHTHPLIERYVDDLVVVGEEAIANAILTLLEREKTLAEGAAAAPLAALQQGRVPGVEDQQVAVVLSGGNIDVNLLTRIIERGLLQDGRMALLRVLVSDRPGGLAGLTALVAEAGANVLRLDHQRGTGELWLTEAEVALLLETRGHDHVQEVVAALEERGYRVTSVGR